MFDGCFFTSIFQLNRSDSDSSTLSKKTPFVRNAMERRSVRVKRVKASLLAFCLVQMCKKRSESCLKGRMFCKHKSVAKCFHFFACEILFLRIIYLKYQNVTGLFNFGVCLEKSF